jgi:hypothetical protein
MSPNQTLRKVGSSNSIPSYPQNQTLPGSCGSLHDTASCCGLMRQDQCTVGTVLTTKKCLFCEVVKIYNRLHYCVPLVEMVKKHIWNVQFMVRIRELCLWENICLGYWYFRSETSWRENELLVLPVQDWNFRWLVEEDAVWRENELPVLPVLDQYYRCSLTRSIDRCLFWIWLLDLNPICF